MFILLGNLLLFLTIWLHFTYDDVRLDQILYQIQTPAAGTQRNLTLSMILCILASIFFSLTEIILMLYYSARLPKKYYKNIDRFREISYNKICYWIRRFDFTFGIFSILCVLFKKVLLFFWINQF